MDFTVREIDFYLPPSIAASLRPTSRAIHMIITDLFADQSYWKHHFTELLRSMHGISAGNSADGLDTAPFNFDWKAAYQRMSACLSIDTHHGTLINNEVLWNCAPINTRPTAYKWYGTDGDDLDSIKRNLKYLEDHLDAITFGHRVYERLRFAIRAHHNSCAKFLIEYCSSRTFDVKNELYHLIHCATYASNAEFLEFLLKGPAKSEQFLLSHFLDCSYDGRNKIDTVITACNAGSVGPLSEVDYLGLSAMMSMNKVCTPADYLRLLELPLFDGAVITSGAFQNMIKYAVDARCADLVYKLLIMSDETSGDIARVSCVLFDDVLESGLRFVKWMHANPRRVTFTWSQLRAREGRDQEFLIYMVNNHPLVDRAARLSDVVELLSAESIMKLTGNWF